MPRPAAKRNRFATRTLGASKQTQSHDPSRDNTVSRDISRSPRSEAMGSSRLTTRADPSEVIRQLRNQTPLSKSHEFAIGSSPGTEQGATGSRPPTRTRGYSSTLSIAGRKGDTSSRIPGTPAFESSILSNFRRRPRQASILHMMQDDEGSSELDDDDFLGGLSPEDESTPLNISRGKSLVLRPAVSSPAASSPEKSPSLPSSNKSSKRKRSIEAPMDPNSPSDAANSAPASPTPELDSRQRRKTAGLQRSMLSPTAVSETMVPPMSSPVPDLTHEMSTPDTDRQSSRTKKPRSHKASQPNDSKGQVPTAALQDRLLPRRRQRRPARQGASRFEELSESDEEDVSPPAPDDDELSYLPMRKPSQARRQPASKAKPAVTKSKPARGSSAIRQYGASSRKDATGGKENEPADMSSPLSSALDTDELDSELELDAETPVTSYLSEELRLQALKFAEVDKWQMEFEDVIIANTQETGAFR